MWTDTGVSAEVLRAERRKVVRLGGRQVLLIAQGDRVFAIANRCPHEGYPLSEGSEGPGCVLTCNWHNWKFDLATGNALVGRDPVRTYPVELRGGAVLLDLTDPPADALKARALAGLTTALDDNDRPRMAREAARLERAGFDIGVALSHALQTRNERLEGGMTHAHAAAADWLALAARAPDEATRFAAQLEPLSHLSWDTLGAGDHPFAGRVARWDAQAFLDAMECENEDEAVARVRGAAAENIPYGALRPVFAESALSHYADFGHSAIYVLKAGQLLDRLGGAAKEAVLLALTRQHIRATREERLPEFRGYGKALACWDGNGRAPVRAQDFIGLTIAGALARTLESSGRDPREIYDALLGAAAWNLLHFDTAFDTDAANAIADNVSWLDFTHALTFANACRHICTERPDLWPRALLQLALFAGRNRGYVDSGEDGARWRVDDPSVFIASGMEALYDHGIVEPIIACHRLKMLFALEDELAAAPDAPWAEAMCAAMNRWLSTPQKRHHGLRIATQAREFVAREA
ncbi:MAG TPA: Rieske (2Fe-2S) protein [Rhizomicrobium sp.]|nr:Rieske (2Fe-2S) protein [Rhizomicrobium sp.]